MFIKTQDRIKFSSAIFEFLGIDEDEHSLKGIVSIQNRNSLANKGSKRVQDEETNAEIKSLQEDDSILALRTNCVNGI